MECPHCSAEITVTPHSFALGEDSDGAWQVSNLRCPTCERLVVNLCNKQGDSYPIRPLGSCRPLLGGDVPDDYAEDYHTACRVLPYSAEASAALSRRLLHKLLAVKTSAGHGSLSDQIRQAVVGSDLPPYLKQALQTLTRIAKVEPGSAKSEHPEALSPADPGEPEWLLDVLQSMLDLYFVEPAKMQRKQAQLEAMLAPPEATPQGDAGPAGSAATSPAATTPAAGSTTGGTTAATPSAGGTTTAAGAEGGDGVQAAG